MNIIEKIQPHISDKKNDGIAFVPSKKGFDLSFFSLKGRKKYVIHNLGHMYHIILYKQQGNKIFDVEKFESILTAPEYYIENVIKAGFFGVVVKMTEKNHSKKFINAIYKNLIDG